MKILIGKVISVNKMNNTIIVLTYKYIKHFIYKKYIIKKKKYYVDDYLGLANINNLVEIIYVRPLSKIKFWKILKFLT